MTDTITEIDCSTGEETSRPLTPEEQTQLDAQRGQAAAAALEQAWVDVRQERNVKLTGSDWIVDPPADLPASVVAEIDANREGWLAYREALRNLPESGEDPYGLVWPEPPPAPTLPSTVADVPSRVRGGGA